MVGAFGAKPSGRTKAADMKVLSGNAIDLLTSILEMRYKP